jgi:hypothetical protein
MATGAPLIDPEEELRQLDEELTRLRAEVEDLQQRFVEHWDDPADGVDRTEALTAIEEDKALIEVLEQRQGELRGLLGLG